MTGALDPRERSDGLGLVARALFGEDRMRVWIGDAGDECPAGWRVVARYAIAPSVERARFLLPITSRSAVVSSVLAYNALRPRGVRIARYAVGQLSRLGALWLRRFPILRVAVPAAATDRDVLLTSHLAAELGVPRLHAAIGVRPPDPNYKPTLQLFDDAGRPRTFVKVGWNEATRMLVGREADALRDLPRDRLDFPLVPRLQLSGEWAEKRFAAVEPLPADVRRVPENAKPRTAAMLAIARLDCPDQSPARLSDSRFVKRLGNLAAVAARESSGNGGRWVADRVEAYRDRFGEVLITEGAWHGDWVPWNLAISGRDRLVAWDWEHSGADVLLGFDLAHQRFQTALVVEGRSAWRASQEAERFVRTYGAALGIQPATVEPVVTGYLLEMWFRTWRLATAGAGWNRALHPSLLAVLGDRLGSGPMG